MGGESMRCLRYCWSHHSLYSSYDGVLGVRATPSASTKVVKHDADINAGLRWHTMLDADANRGLISKQSASQTSCEAVYHSVAYRALK